MTKAELVEAVSSEFPNKSAANRAVTLIFQKISESLKKENDAFIMPGFGSFKVIKRKERIGRNPRTGQTITIPEGLAIRFHQSRAKAAAE